MAWSTTSGIVGINRSTTGNAQFNPSIKTNMTSYGLVLNRNVKQSYVRLQEGNRDSGRVHSVAASNTTTSRTITAKTTMSNSLTQVMTFNYGWIYF